MLRDTVLVLAAAVYVTVPFPVPFVLENVTQVTGLDAVQAQPLIVLTTMLLLPPAEVNDPDEGAIE